jgi:uncharacterized membrane protein
MPALEALRTAVDSLVESPILFAAGLVYGLVLLPQTATQLLGLQFAPLLLQVVTFFVTPFIIAGLIGMADESIAEGSTTLGRLSDVGRERYIPLLLGNLVQFGIVLVFIVLFAIVVLAGAVTLGLGGVAGGGAAVAGGALVLVAVVALLVLVFLVVSFFIQFYQVAIVAGEADTIEGYKESISLVRANLLATFGYSVINLVVGILTSAPITGFVVWRSLQQSGGFSGAGGAAGGTPPMAGGTGGAAMGSLFSTTEAIALALITLALAMVLTTFQQTYATAFYRRHDTGQSIEERVLDDESEAF